MKVFEIMSKSVLTIKAEESVQDAASAMVRHDHGMIVVVDKFDEKKIIGIVTDRDIIEKVVAKNRNLTISVSEIMSKNVTSITADASIDEAKKLLEQRHIKRMPVLHDNKLVGILSFTDIMKF